MSTVHDTAARAIQREFRAMATDVHVRVEQPTPDAPRALAAAEEVFRRVESACTRFVATSPLMRANAAPDEWHDVPAECAHVVAEAARAHRETDGIFDPRVLDDLLRLGYDRTLPFDEGPVDLTTALPEAGPDKPARTRRPPWEPRCRNNGVGFWIHLDGTAIDLGGIGKGYAVREAAWLLEGAGASAMVEAGGDCGFRGAGPDGAGWRVGVEDPRGGTEPLAVLRLTDTGCATSSTRVRRWTVDGQAVHHLIDPATGRSGGDGLLSVTVVHPDTAWAEVWSKSLFLAGAGRIADLADGQRLAAVWVESSGALRVSDAAWPHLLWTVSHGSV